MDLYYTESSGVDSSPDMNSSIEMASLSPDRSVMPRKLTFGLSPDQDIQRNLIISPKKQLSDSPPYRKVRALR